MKNVASIIQRAEASCRDRGERLTTKRKLVLSALLQSDKALSAYDVIDTLKQDHGEAIPSMSAYRILDFLESVKLVHKLKLANKYVACSHIACEEAHCEQQFLICGECGKVEEISMKKTIIDDIREGVESANFHLVSPQLEMNCICSDCKAKAA